MKITKTQLRNLIREMVEMEEDCSVVHEADEADEALEDEDPYLANLDRLHKSMAASREDIKRQWADPKFRDAMAGQYDRKGREGTSWPRPYEGD